MRLHQHARARMHERGAAEEEIEATIREGERFPAKFGREGFRRNFRFDGIWRGRHYAMKQIEAFAIFENGDWLVISVIVKYF
ncbi:MAG: hypothetical protein AB7H71_16310 [Alphaproteobacteria bacterium]